ncbi:MAG: DNA recombination protein RmuC [Planctomycetota bacterium]
MDPLILLFAVVSLSAGGVAVWALLGHAKLAAQASANAAERDEARERVRTLEATLQTESERGVDLRLKAQKLEQELEAAEALHATQVEGLRERERDLAKQAEEMAKKSEQTFESLAGRALSKSTDEFLKLAKQSLATESQAGKAELEQRRKAVEEMVKPIREVLTKTEERLTRLDQRITSDGEAREQLATETARLAKALSRPEVRGRYGEIQLRRVAELAGLTSYCDFDEQSSTRDDEGNLQRPDMIVTLPAGRSVAVDAKTNTFAYLEAVNAESEDERESHLDDFARHVADQIKKLSDKKYWSNYDGSPEFVVMFVPGDHFIDAALARKPDLIEKAAEQNVILASPSTLIGLLRAVAVGWREHSLAEHAHELYQLGRELHERSATAFEHASRLGESIKRTVDQYNKLAGSIDTRFTPTLKKFEEHGVKSAKELPEPPEITVQPRSLVSGEEPEKPAPRTTRRKAASQS